MTKMKKTKKIAELVAERLGEGFTAEAVAIEKNNNEEKHGIRITKAGNDVSPLIYTNEILEAMDDEEVVEHVIKTYTESLMYVITSHSRTFGAVGMLDNDLLADLADKLDSDVYVLPSSVHEVIVVTTDASKDELREVVESVNCTNVSAEEFLSNSVYEFSRESKTLEMAV